MFDFHMHSRVSCDTDSDPLAMVLAAKNAGLREICFTDHSDYCPGVAHSTISFSREQYRTAYENLSVPGITIRHGMELGLSSEFTEEMDAEIAAFPYDFILGSIHCVDGIDTYFPELWRGRDPRQIERRYFEAMLDCVSRCNCFDVLSHMTFISKSPCNPAPGSFRRRITGNWSTKFCASSCGRARGWRSTPAAWTKSGTSFRDCPTCGGSGSWAERSSPSVPMPTPRTGSGSTSPRRWTPPGKFSDTCAPSSRENPFFISCDVLSKFPVNCCLAP